MPQATYLLAFCCVVMACVAGSSVAVLPCGGAQLLTSQNATNMTLVVANCWQSEATEVLLHGAEGTAIDNMTLLVSHSMHVRVVVDGVRLVHSTVSLVNVSYPGDCSACAAAGGGSVVRVRNASIEGSTVTVSGALVPPDAGRALLSIEASNVTQSLLALRSSDVGTVAVVEFSSITDSNVTLHGVAVRMRNSSSAAAVLSLRAVTLERTQVAAVNFTCDVSDVSSSPLPSSVLVENCSLHHTALLLRNVSARVLGLNASSTSRQRLLSVNRSTVAASSVTLTEVDSVNVGLFGTSGSTWTAGSSVVLDVFRVRSEVAAMPCAAASFEASALHGAVVALFAGAMSTLVNVSGDVLCVVDCRVDTTVLSAWQLTIEEEQQSTGGLASAPSTPSGEVRGVFSVIGSSLQSTQLHLSDVLVNVTSASALVLSGLQVSSSRLTVTSSLVAAARGVRLQHSELIRAHLHVFSSVLTTANTAMEVLNCTAANLTANLTACRLTSESSSSWLVDASIVTFSSIVVQRTWLSAAGNTFLLQKSTLTATNVTLVDSNVTATQSWAWLLWSSNMTAGSISVLRTWLSAASRTFEVQGAVLTAANVTLLDSNVTAAASWAWYLSSSTVTAGSIAVQRTWLSSEDSTFRVEQTTLTTTNVTLVDSNVTAAASWAWYLSSSIVTAGSIAVLRTWLSAASNTFEVERTALTATNMTLVDSNLTAAAFKAWFLLLSKVVGGSIAVQRTWLSAENKTYVVDQTALTATNMTLLDSNVTAAAAVAWFLWSSNVAASSIAVQRTWLSAASGTFAVEKTTLTATRMTLVDSNVTATASAAWSLKPSNVTAGSIVLLRTWLRAASSTLVVQQSVLTATSFTLLDSNVTAVASVAWVVSLSNVTDSSIAVQRTWLSAASMTLIVQQTVLTGTNVTLVDSNVTAAASAALFFSSSNATGGSIAVQRAWLSASSHAFLVQQSVLTAANVTLVDSNVTAAASWAWIVSLSNATGGSFTVLRTWLSATSNTLHVQQTALTATNVTLVDSNVTAAASIAWFLWSSNVTASSIFVQRTWLSAASYTFQVQQTALIAANVTLVDSNVTAAALVAWSLSSSNVTCGSIAVLRTWLCAGSQTFEVQQAVLTATNMLLVDSNVTAAALVAWLLSSSNVTASSIAVQRTWLRAQSSTFRVEQTAWIVTNVTLLDSNVTAALSAAWYLFSSNVMASTIAVQRTWLSAASYTYVVHQSTLTATNVALVDSNVTAAASAAWYLLSSTVAGGSFTVLRTWLSAASFTFQVQQTALTATNMTLVDTSVTAAASKAWVVVSSNVTVGSIVALRCAVCAKGSVLEFRGVVVTMSLLAFRWCTFARASVTADDLSGPAVLRVVASTVVSSSLMLQGGSYVCRGEGVGVLRVVSSSVTEWSVHALDVVVWLCKTGRITSARRSDAASMIVFESSVATVFSVVWRLSTVVGIRAFLLCNDSSVELERFEVGESNISTVDDGSATNSFVGAFNKSTVYIRNATVERSRFVDFTTMFGVLAASGIVVADSAYRCSWWSSAAATITTPSTATILRWRPLTKLHLGTATFKAPPVFAGDSDGDAGLVCGFVTVSVSLSRTASALELSSSRSALPSSTETLLLTASGNTATYSRSATTTSEATATRIVAQRVVQMAVGARESAAIIGATIAATSFATVRAGLTAQRIGFVLRSGGRKCGALSDDHIVVDVEDVDWLSSPTRLSVGSGAAAVHRGAVLGNVAVCVGVALLAAAAVGCAMAGWGLRASAAMSRMHVRHVLCVPVMLLLQPTLASSVTLLQDAAGAAADVAIGAAGVACLACAIVGVGRVLDPRDTRFRARALALPQRSLVITLPASVLHTMRGVWRWWTAASDAWRPRDGSGRFVLDWGFLFDDTRGERHWWALVDVGVSVVLGVVPATSSSCAAWKWGVVAAACGGVVLPVVLVPLSSPRAMCECVMMALMTALVAVLGAVDAGDAVIEGIGILAAVVPWAPLVLSAVGHAYGLLVRRGDKDVPDRVPEAGCMAVEARSSGVYTSWVRDALRGAGAGASRFAPRHLSPAACTSRRSIFTRPQVSESVMAPRARSRMRRQATALRALVSLICCHQNEA